MLLLEQDLVLNLLIKQILEQLIKLVYHLVTEKVILWLEQDLVLITTMQILESLIIEV